MRRPSLQFYPGDWMSNAKLKRCTHAERGIWMTVLCLMHDSEEYGVLRWSLVDLARAIGCKVGDLRSLASRCVLKGADTNEQCAPFVFTPRHAGRDGDPVILIKEQSGPLWYSSRMVRDEYVRTKRGIGSRFGDEPKDTPKPPIGYGPSSSSSSSVNLTPLPPSGKFEIFWQAWPKGDRKQAKGKCLQAWHRKRCDAIADQILAHVESLKQTDGWQTGYVPAPLVYLNQSRWEGAETPEREQRRVAL